MQKTCSLCGRPILEKGKYCDNECKEIARKRTQEKNYRLKKQKAEEARRTAAETSNAVFMLSMEQENARRRAAGLSIFTYGQYVAWRDGRAGGDC